MKLFQKGFNYSQDGPGNRLVLHLQGCNMRCPWCSNPEGLEMQGVLMVDEQWLYPELCPHGAIKDQKLNRFFCEHCESMECITGYRSKGLRLSCQEYSVDEVLELILSSKPMFYDGGGVTFTGGECTLQFEELQILLKRLKEYEIHTAIETNGSHRGLEELFDDIDVLIMDCKLIDSKKHELLMGISNKMILTNIRKAAGIHPHLHIRVPMIGGVNNAERERKELIDFFQSLPHGNVSYEVLTYHEFGKKKWSECGLKYRMNEEAKLQIREVSRFKDEIKAAGLNYQST